MSMLFKRIKDWATNITSFRTGDVIPVDGPSGTAKMSKDNLLKEAAENALGSIKSLSNRATEDDIISGNDLVLDGAAGPKKLDVALMAKARSENEIYREGEFSLKAQTASTTDGMCATKIITTNKFVGENCGFISLVRVKVNGSSCAIYKCRWNPEANVLVHTKFLTSISVSVEEAGTIKEIAINEFFGENEFPAISGGFYRGGNTFYGKTKRGAVSSTNSMDLPISYNNDDGVAMEVIAYASIEGNFAKEGEAVTEDLSRFNISNQYLNQNSGSVNSSSGCDLTDFIPVNEGDVFYYSGFVTKNHNPVWGFTNKNSNYPEKNGAQVLLNGSSTYQYNKKVVIPSGVSYIRAWSRNTSNTLTPAELKLLKVKKIFNDVFQHFSCIVVDKNGGGDYTELSDAIKSAGDNSSNHVTIIVMPGEYAMPPTTEVDRASTWNRNLSIVGVDKCKCILKNSVGLYATGSEPGVTEYVDNGCLVLSGNLYIANLTIESTDTNFPADLADGLRRSYCVHMDGSAQSGSVAEVHNCILRNSHSACIGIGLRKNTEVRVTDCICESNVNPALDTMFGRKYFGIIQGHDDGTSSVASEEKLIVKNNILRNVGTNVAIRWGVQSGATPSLLTFVGNAIKTTDNTTCLYLGSNTAIDSISSGNNVNGLNA